MASSPDTARPGTATHPQAPKPANDGQTPTQAAFNSGGADPRVSQSQEHAHADDSSPKSSQRDSMDVDMDDSDNDGGHDENGGSDGESVNADGTKSKKKKSQRFYCTDYPPCNLSFTRSEHLARHIRKHTGERPFQCHCSRRFSRLDNLRQHAQTVHVNEDIPIDSLAATGSRFQRQIRTDRVRQAAGNRARASTGGSAGGPARGHSKSLSTSSINSIGSVGSAYGMQPDTRRRPPPLVMASDPRSRMSLESYRSGVDSSYSYRPQSPGDFSTPTSATFSTAQSSPRWPSGMGSPSSSHSRSHSMYTPDDRTPGRRLSVPSGVPPMQSPQGHPPGRLSFGPALVNSSNAGAFSPPANGHFAASPSGSSTAWSHRRDSASSGTADDAWRRRTWHPDSRSLNGQQPGLSAVANQSAAQPNPPPPIANPSSPQSNMRLPGIESFDPIIHRPPTPPRGRTSPMAVDSEPSQRRTMPPGIMDAVPIDDRRNLNMYDASLQRGINRLDIGHRTPPRDSAGSWATEANKAVQAQAERTQSHVRFEEPPREQYNTASASRSLHQHTMSAPSFATSRESKRHGWYHGPVSSSREAPPQPQQEPRAAQVEKMVHPNFNGFSGFPAREHQQQQQQQPHQQQQHQQQQQQQERSNNPDSLRRLEALVAVATSEGSTATAY